MPDEQRKLRVAFESPEDFQREFDSNLANGGVFVRTADVYALRETVQVELYFDYSDESICFDAEVVHIVSTEMAEVGGKQGVAVQFQMPVQELRERLGRMAGGSGERSGASPPADEGQRAAPRKSVRVAAQLQGEQQTITGQTRNLSLTGALVGVGGHPIPLGENVSLVLEHPTTGEKRTLEGKVVRQVESKGEVSAVAVEFARGEGADDDQRFVEEIQGVEHTRRLGAISGPIDELGPLALLQMFATTAQKGTLVLRCDQEEGLVCFDGGLLRLARLGSTTGMKALVRILGWSDGVFEFSTHVDDSQLTAPPFPLEAALFEAARQIDEGTTVDSARFPLQSRIGRVQSGDADAYGELSKVESAVLDLSAAGFTVQRALEVIPEPDPEIFRALQGLSEAGLIYIAD